MNIRSIKNLSLLFGFSAMILSSCYQEPITEIYEEVPPVRCEQILQDAFSLNLPCEWNVQEYHPESGQIGIIDAGKYQIYFEATNYTSWSQITPDPTTSSYYPTVDGYVSYVEEVINGQTIVYAYYLGEDQETLVVSYVFWFIKKEGTETVKDIMTSLTHK